MVNMNWNVVEQRGAKGIMSELVNWLVYKHDPQGHKAMPVHSMPLHEALPYQ